MTWVLILLGIAALAVIAVLILFRGYIRHCAGVEPEPTDESATAAHQNWVMRLQARYQAWKNRPAGDGTLGAAIIFAILAVEVGIVYRYHAPFHWTGQVALAAAFLGSLATVIHFLWPLVRQWNAKPWPTHIGLAIILAVLSVENALLLHHRAGGDTRGLWGIQVALAFGMIICLGIQLWKAGNQLLDDAIDGDDDDEKEQGTPRPPQATPV